MSGDSVQRKGTDRMLKAFVGAAAIAAVSSLAAAGQAQAPAAPGKTDPSTAILAAHRKADDAYGKVPMSPFTAVAVQYFQPRQAVKLGVGPGGARFGAAPAGQDVLELTLDDGAFWVTPVSGLHPFVAKTDGNGAVTGLPGVEVRTKTKLAPRDVLRVGRLYVECYARPDTGNARVFDPESPQRKAYTGLKWYPPNPALAVKARFAANPSPSAATITTSRGLQKEYFRVGTFEFTVEGRPLQLTALATAAAPKPDDELFVAFRDSTTGKETYNIGRYLFIPFRGADAVYTLDFNAASNPLCNYSPHYNCPIPPRENTLPVGIRAGEMTYPHD
jgi:uncharacterized protein (DUF1684 family)